MSKQQSPIVKETLSQLSDIALKQGKNKHYNNAEAIFNECLKMAKEGVNNETLRSMANLGLKWYVWPKSISHPREIGYITHTFCPQNNVQSCVDSHIKRIDCGNGVRLLIIQNINEDFGWVIGINFRIAWD